MRLFWGAFTGLGRADNSLPSGSGISAAYVPLAVHGQPPDSLISEVCGSVSSQLRRQ